MHIHILGICGTFMGGLAALAAEAGHKVTGCDTAVYPPMSDQLRALGIELIEGYGTEQLAFNPDVFVVGNVVSRIHLTDRTPKYPLMEAILDGGLPYTSGPQWLAEHVLQGRHVLAVAGTHGKTTTTAMLTWILECAGLQPGFLVGGVPLNFGVSARLGRAVLGKQEPQKRLSRAAGAAAPLELEPAAPNLPEQVGTGSESEGFAERRPAGGSVHTQWESLGATAASAGPPQARPAPSGGSVHTQWESEGATFVIEADEYDTAFFDKRSKFVHYRPRTAILNNLEFDHADIFDNLAAIEKQFHHLLRTVPANGRVVVNASQESLERVIAQGCWSEQVLFGNAHANKDGFTAVGEPHAFDVLKAGQVVAKVHWAVSGVHNQLNALAAIAAAEHVGVAPQVAADALASFQNVKRRMEVKGVVSTGGGCITVYDDFAHHPTAIHTTIDGLRRQLNSAGKTADRILAVFEPRSTTMKLGTMAAQLPKALEAADFAFCHAGGLDWDAKAALAPMVDRASVASNIDELVRAVKAKARPGDHLLCMSNGGFGGIHGKLLAALQH